jgi:hypothetical protein
MIHIVEDYDNITIHIMIQVITVISYHDTGESYHDTLLRIMIHNNTYHDTTSTTIVITAYRY